MESATKLAVPEMRQAFQVWDVDIPERIALTKTNELVSAQYSWQE